MQLNPNHTLVNAMPLCDGLQAHSSSSVADVLTLAAQNPNASAFAIIDNSQTYLGFVSLGAVLAAQYRHGAHTIVTSIDLNKDCHVSYKDTVSTAQMRMSQSPTDVVAVLDEQNGFKGFLTAKVLVQFLAKSASRKEKNVTEISSLAKQFASHVAHDLRNPLCVISSVCELLERASSPGDQYHKFSELIRRASRQALQLSDGLIQAERYACANKIFPQKINLLDLLEEIHTENSELLRFKGKRLYVEACDAAEVEIDSYLIKRALLNLIENAAKHSRANGGIYLSAKICSDNNREIVEFAVRDEGEGIKKQDAKKIFDPFVQLDTDQRALGYGLGLAIAKHFSELHGGTIRAEAPERRGARFVLSLPAHRSL